MFTVYRIAFAPALNLYQKGLLFTRSKKVIATHFFCNGQKLCSAHPAIKWPRRVTYRIDQCSYLIPDSSRVGTKNYSVQCESSVIFNLYCAILCYSFSVLYSNSSMGFKEFFFVKQSHQFLSVSLYSCGGEELIITENAKY